MKLFRLLICFFALFFAIGTIGCGGGQITMPENPEKEPEDEPEDVKAPDLPMDDCS